jgi:hypothetical protein
MLYFACRRAALSILGAAIFTCVLAQSGRAATVAVGTCTNLAFYPTIQQAVNSVPANSTIKVCPGTYAEQVIINKSMTLTGVSSTGVSGPNASGPDNPVIVSPTTGVVANANDLFDGSPIAGQIVVVTPSGAVMQTKVTLNYIAVDGSNNQLASCGTDLVGIYYQNASGTINQMVTRYQELSQNYFGCQQGLAIYVQSGFSMGGTAVVTIQNNSVHDYDKNGITADGSGTVATITGNYVVGIGATPLIAQNGIQVSDGATGSVKNNTVTDDVYVNPPNCSPNCFGSSGILIFDSGATATSHLAISGNTVSNTQLAVVTYGDSAGAADYNDVSINKITGTLAAGVYLDDGIDLCSNNNTATSNTIYNSSGAGVHIDSQCTESSGKSGNNTTVTKNTINEACAGVMMGTGSGNNTGMGATLNTAYNVVQVLQPGDSCPAGAPTASKAAKVRLRAQPRHL